METVIWSDLQGDLQQPDVGGERGCALSRTKVSADLFLGVPFNIASYALLTQMLAQQCGLKLGDLIWTGGDVHIYKNHIEQVETQLSREPRMLPVMYLKRRPASIFDYKYEDFELAGYDPHPTIKAPVAV
jgi:thymidylate synthase